MLRGSWHLGVTGCRCHTGVWGILDAPPPPTRFYQAVHSPPGCLDLEPLCLASPQWLQRWCKAGDGRGSCWRAGAGEGCSLSAPAVYFGFIFFSVSPGLCLISSFFKWVIRFSGCHVVVFISIWGRGRPVRHIPVKQYFLITCQKCSQGAQCCTATPNPAGEPTSHRAHATSRTT